jgi:AraC-like DNA-binding protein
LAQSVLRPTSSGESGHNVRSSIRYETLEKTDGRIDLAATILTSLKAALEAEITRTRGTTADQFNDTPSPTDLQQFVYLANDLVELLETAMRELERDREAAKASLAKASIILQSETVRRSGANGSKAGGLAGWQIARVQAFIDENLHHTVHTKDLSAVARLSRGHFSRSFKRAFGEPPHAYLMRKRLERACHLMMTGAASLSEIASSVGFSDQAHLCRLFTQAFGQSPANWRRDFESRRGLRTIQ